MACLVRQLFRLKIGRDVDPALIDDVMFPLLLTQRYQPNQLLQDIKLTRGREDYVDKYGRHKGSSLILLEREDTDEEDDDQVPYYDNIGHFTKRPISTPQDTDLGKWTSAITMRDVSPRDWGTIDIVNKLRSLKKPHHHDSRIFCRWIYLEDVWSPHDEDSTVTESFICNALQEGKRLDWTGQWCWREDRSIYTSQLYLVG
jgi:hypothetical protein